MAFLDEIGLQYYDTKLKEYIGKKIGNAVGNITSLRFEVITELPQTGEAGVIYLKALSDQEFNNLYEEFIWIGNGYELIGTTEIDLTNYYTKSEIEVWVDNNYEKKLYVDLGLPSGLLWATCNVGANSPEDYGDYFAWGETTTKHVYAWITYKYGSSASSLTKYTFNQTTLELIDDAARANWGGNWRIPTATEIAELREQCTWTWTTLNGVNGYKVTSKSNGNSIFLPAAGCREDSSLDYAGSTGYYWSNQLYTSMDWDKAKFLHFDSGHVFVSGGTTRYFGHSVRPVCEPSMQFDDTKTKEEIINSTDGVYYFTTDTKQIYRNGERYCSTSLEGYATEEFVTSQGYLTEVPENVITEETLSQKNYTTQTQVQDYVNESLTDYITVDDLSNYGFLTEVPSEYVTDGELEEMGYATEAWVQDKGYLTEHQDISNLATKEEIPSLDGYATEQWVEEQGYIKNIPPHTVTINFYNDIDYAVWHNMVGDIEITSMQSTNVLDLYVSDGNNLNKQDVESALDNGPISITNGSTLTFDVIKTTDANGFAAVTLTYNIK